MYRYDTHLETSTNICMPLKIIEYQLGDMA